MTWTRHWSAPGSHALGSLKAPPEENHVYMGIGSGQAFGGPGILRCLGLSPVATFPPLHAPFHRGRMTAIFHGQNKRVREGGRSQNGYGCGVEKTWEKGRGGEPSRMGTRWAPQGPVEAPKEAQPLIRPPIPSRSSPPQLWHIPTPSKLAWLNSGYNSYKSTSQAESYVLYILSITSGGKYM